MRFDELSVLKKGRNTQLKHGTSGEKHSSLKAIGLFALAVCAWAGPRAVAPVPNPCTPRFLAGSVIHNPPALHSANGALNVRFSYQQTTASAGRLLHCLMTDTGLQEP